MKKNHPKSLAKRPILISELLGQVFTPPEIANKMIRLLLDNYNLSNNLKVLDPAVGPFTFPKAIVETGLETNNISYTAVDVDKAMFMETKKWFKSHEINYNVLHADYLELHLDNQFDLAIFNPPYVRQEWLDKKQLYRSLFEKRFNIYVPGTSNLYVYFVVKVIMDLKPGGNFVCIIYDSWQSTIYGRWLIEFMNETCELIQVESVTEQPFHNRLINATIIKGTKKTSSSQIQDVHRSKKINHPSKSKFSHLDGFSSIQSIFNTKRGLRLKQANFFLSNQEMLEQGATPFVKKIGKVKGFSVPNDHPETALLIGDNPDSRVIDELNRRITQAKLDPEANVSILTWYNERPDSWFKHSDPPFAEIIFNYYLRNRPRHIYNPNRAYSDNFYGLVVPKDTSVFAYLAILNSTAVCNEILELSRSQGNGLQKIQLFEYREAFIPDICKLNKEEKQYLHELGTNLVDYTEQSEDIIENIDNFIWKIYGYSELEPNLVKECLNDKLSIK